MFSAVSKFIEKYIDVVDRLKGFEFVFMVVVTIVVAVAAAVLVVVGAIAILIKTAPYGIWVALIASVVYAIHVMTKRWPRR